MLTVVYVFLSLVLNCTKQFFHSIILASFCMWDFWRLNKAKEADCAARGLDESQKGHFTELGSESPLFRYALYIGRVSQALRVTQRFMI